MDFFEIQELAATICGLSEKQFEDIINEDESKLDEILWEKFRVDFDEFGEIAKALLLLTPAVGSELTKKRYHAFVIEEKGYYRAITKKECKQREE